MAPARPNVISAPLPKGNAHGAVFFRFVLDLENKTPFDGTPFTVFISDDLGLSATATLAEKAFHAFYEDDDNNWFRLFTTYAYAQIYGKTCLLTDTKLNEAGSRAFVAYASKLIKLTFHGNKILLNAAPDDWALLKNSVQHCTRPQAAQPQEQSKAVQQPQEVQQPQAVEGQAVSHKAVQRRHRSAGYEPNPGPRPQRLR